MLGGGEAVLEAAPAGGSAVGGKRGSARSLGFTLGKAMRVRVYAAELPLLVTTDPRPGWISRAS
jgi:hypothetical protein